MKHFENLKKLGDRWPAQSLSKTVAAVALATAVLAGCGGGGGGDSVSLPQFPIVGGLVPVTTPIPDPSSSVQSVVDYILALITGNTSESGSPIDINGLTLVTDETSPPVALN